jgi:hypothetical protein
VDLEDWGFVHGLRSDPSMQSAAGTRAVAKVHPTNLRSQLNLLLEGRGRSQTHRIHRLSQHIITCIASRSVLLLNLAKSTFRASPPANFILLLSHTASNRMGLLAPVTAQYPLLHLSQFVSAQYSIMADLERLPAIPTSSICVLGKDTWYAKTADLEVAHI